MTTKIPDVETDWMLYQLDHLPQDDIGLADIVRGAAFTFAAYTLWADQPVEHQGDTHPRAVELRAQRADAARLVWLAASAALRVRELTP